MKNKLLILCLGIFLMSLTSAYNLTAGESINITLPEEYKYYEITDNSTEVNLNITKNEILVTIEISKYMKSDSFTLTFFNEKNEIIDSSGSSGGGSCKYNKNFDWECSEWSECINETQTRICKEYNNCGNTYGKPNESQSCLEPEPEEPFRPLEIVSKNWGYILTGILIILIMCVLYIIFKQIKNRKNKPTKKHGKKKTKN